MTRLQLLKANRSLIELLRSNSIRLKDVEMTEMVETANTMLKNGDQKCYIVAVLAQRYNVSIRTIYSTIGRLNEEILL